MTENLLHKLEEKMMMLLTEIEDARQTIAQLTQENTLLRTKEQTHTDKVLELISLLDAIEVSDSNMTTMSMPAMKPVLVQG